MNRQQELEKLFKSYKEMELALHKLSNKYLEEEPLSFEEYLLYSAMFLELGWDDKADFLSGVGELKVITINVPEGVEEE